MRLSTACDFIRKEFFQLGFIVENNWKAYANLVEHSEILTKKELKKLIQEYVDNNLIR